MKNKPQASVVMPAYNAQEHIQNAINSILKQTFEDFEFLIIDDNSQDSTAQIIEKSAKSDRRIKVLKNKKNLGVAKSLNKAVRIAKGKYIIRMDSDDWSYPNRFAKQIYLMEKYPNVVVSGSHIYLCDQHLMPKYLRKYGLSNKEIRLKMFRYSPFAHPATIWRKNTLKKVGMYNENLGAAQDYELYFRIGNMGEFRNINKPLLKLRMHKDSVSVSRSKEQIDNTFKIRDIAVTKYKYKMSKLDNFYNISHKMAYKFIPSKHRFHLFNFFRRFDFY